MATGAGLPTTALITAMDQPLASAAGNAVEVRNAVDFLNRAQPRRRLEDVTIALCTEMLVLGGLARDHAEGQGTVEQALASGAAAEHFARMVAALGGPADFMEHAGRYLPAAPVIRPVFAADIGPIGAIDTRAVGLGVVALGGGRTRPQDAIDHAVGFTELAALGEHMTANRPLGFVHARSEDAAEEAGAALRSAYWIGAGEEALAPVIERIAGV